VGGQATDIEIHARDLIATRRTLAGIYETHTKKPIDQILKDIERDYYMTAQEAVDYGLVDAIIKKESRTVTPSSSPLQ
jgi:ATP-dependent Clp protease protease subunit